jgi:23S rRNA (adenine2503-C2)-methyltransferase
MRVVSRAGKEDVAVVYIAETDRGRRVEFVESVEPPIPREKKWVLIVSTLHGCPVGCRFCDAGRFFAGKLTKDEIVSQLDYMIERRYPDRAVPAEKFKIQFARMGDPSFNLDVIEVLEDLIGLYDAPGLMPAVSTIAPEGTDSFFERLLIVKREIFQERFQLQFSIHTTDEARRDWLMPCRKWSFERIARYGERFYGEGGRKVTLNFALAEGMPLSPQTLGRFFSPDVFLVKITPVNPTFHASENGIASHIRPGKQRYEIVEALKAAGYDVILSIGELEENHIGSNCGQYVMNCTGRREKLKGGYSYEIRRVN